MPSSSGLPTGAITKGQKIGHATVLHVTRARMPVVGASKKGTAEPSKLEAKFAAMWQVFGDPRYELQTEYAFHPERKWRFDFVFVPVGTGDPLAVKVALELDGGVFSGGRHTRGKGFEGDCDKLNAATSMGWTVLRFTASHLKKSRQVETIERVKQALERKG